MARSFNATSGILSYTATAAQKSLTQISIHWRGYRSGGGEAGFGVISSHATGANRKYIINNDNGNGGEGFVFQAYFSSNQGRWSINYPTNNIWYDFVITFDASSASNDPIWYKDGVSQTVTERVTPSGTILTTDDNIYVGNVSDDSLTWDGRIAEYAVWNRVLSASEVAQLGKGYAPSFIRKGLVFYDPLIRGVGDIVGGVIPSITGTTVIEHPLVIKPNH